jgi:hypothetical protein
LSPRFIPRITAAAAVIPALLLVACGSPEGSVGDPPSEPHAALLGDCARIADLVGEATWLEPNNTDSIGCKPPLDQRVCVSGVTVVAIDKHDETGGGAVGNYYVQDTRKEPLPYSGMTVFDPSFSPPDLRLAPGDVADALGTLTEFLGPSSGRFGGCRTLPEISGAMTLRFEGGSVPPTTIELSELFTYEGARKYLGMLVRLEDVVIGDDPTTSGGRYTAPLKVDVAIPADAIPKLSNELFALETVGLGKSQTFKSITGVITYFYGFKVAPRSAEDLVH